MTLKIHTYELGQMQNLIYIVADTDTCQCAVVDPAWDVPYIVSQIHKLGYTLSMILQTHEHFDHINGLVELYNIFPVPVYISKNAQGQIRQFGIPLFDFNHHDTIQLGNLTIQTLLTPGHSPGGACFLIDDHLVTGDTLFVDGCGRCDLPGSDVYAMYDSLHNIIKPLPDNLRIFPGHLYGASPSDLLGNQKNTNPFLSAKDQSAFLRFRL